MLSPFRMLCGDFILPESANYVSLFCYLNLRNLLYLIRSDGAAGEERRSPENKVHHVGGLRDNGDGREGAGHRHTAGADIAAHPVQDRDTAACTAVLPADRTCDEGPAPPLPRGSELRLLSQARRRVR